MIGATIGRADPGGAPRARGRLGVALLVAALAAIPLLTLEPGILGLFHDDGLYAVAARALAEEGAYRLPSVPGAPFETKYPPLYALLLAAVWRVAPSFPSNVGWLKAVNVASVALTLLGFLRLAGRILGRDARLEAALGAVLLATTPALAFFAANQATSDALFTALVVWLAWAAVPAERPRTAADEALVAALLVAAILTRSVGVAVGAALVVERAWRRRPGAALLHAACTAAAFGGWSLWAARYRDGAGGPLVAYYQQYETTALGYLRSDPALAWSIVEGNLRILGSAVFVLSPAFALAGVAWAALPALGVHALARRGGTVLLAIAATYLAAIVVYPFAPTRYLLPLVPLFCLATVAAGRGLRSRTLRVATVVVAAAPLLLGNALWLARWVRIDGDAVRGWFGDEHRYRWSGFEESFAWVRANTAPGARLATIFDPMYFLYTGRQGIRPWLHRPETYFYPYGAARPSLGTAPEILAELRALQVDYLVFDPPTGYSEGEAARAMLQALVALPEAGAAPVFTSGDGRHRIYRLWCAPGGRPGAGSR